MPSALRGGLRGPLRKGSRRPARRPLTRPSARKADLQVFVMMFLSLHTPSMLPGAIADSFSGAATKLRVPCGWPIAIGVVLTGVKSGAGTPSPSLAVMICGGPTLPLLPLTLCG